MQSPSNKNYDIIIIIIGAGSAGAILAARLSEDPTRSVLLLEAGPDYVSLEDLPDDLKYGYGTSAGIIAIESHDWHYRATTTEQAQIAIARGRVVGGSSAVNAQIFLRCVPDDFAMWVADGNDQWSYEQVLPYFKKLETDRDIQNEYHGHGGPIQVKRYPSDEWLPNQLAFYEACLAAGYPDCPDHNHPDSTGVGPYPLNNIDGIRYSTAVAYLNPIRHRPNLTVLANCTAHGIVFERQRAIGVKVEWDGQIEQRNGGEIVVSAGAIGSPQLLMLSGIGPADHLKQLDVPVRQDLPGVGQNLCDHPAVNMFWHVRDELALDAQKHWHQIGLRYTADGSNLVNDMIVYVAVDPRNRTLFIRPTINLALSRGELTLSSKDPHTQPSLNYRYFDHPFDMARQREAIQRVLTLVQHHGFEEIIDRPIKPLDADLRSEDALTDWILREADTGHHSSSTCKMGPSSDPMSVVDQMGRVHSMSGLRVVDASIMPHCVRANINATTMMMAERIADSL